MRFLIFTIILFGTLFAFENIIPPFIVTAPELSIAPSPSPEITPIPKDLIAEEEIKEYSAPDSEAPQAPMIKPAPVIPEEPILPKQPPQKLYVPSTIIHERTAGSIVNLLCNVGANKVISATGVIASTEGHILSNAHVSEGLIGKECLIRSGSPAKNFAFAKLLFIPEKYIKAESDFERAKHDLSIWKIVRSARESPLPETFHTVAINYATPAEKADQFAVFSYPAEVFSFETILKSLSLLFTNTEVTASDEFFVETVNSLSSQKGSSGGALIDRETLMLRGLIFGVSGDKLAADRTLFSLNPAWISSIVQEETGLSLQQYIHQ